MKHVRITHTYIVPVPAEESERAGLDTVVNRGVTMMENFISAHASNIQELKSSWQMMPREYSRQFEGPLAAPAPTRLGVMRIVEPEEGTQVSFVGNEGGIKHPWDQGLMIFPEGHPLHDLEKGYFDAYRNTGDTRAQEEFTLQLRELGPGDVDA